MILFGCARLSLISKNTAVFLEKEGLKQIETTSNCLPKLERHLQKHQFWGGASKKKSAKRNISTYNFWTIFQENGPQQNSMSIFAKNMLWSYILWWILVAQKALLKGGLLKWLIQRRHRGAQGRSRLRFLEKTTAGGKKRTLNGYDFCWVKSYAQIHFDHLGYQVENISVYFQFSLMIWPYVAYFL